MAIYTHPRHPRKFINVKRKLIKQYMELNRILHFTPTGVHIRSAEGAEGDAKGEQSRTIEGYAIRFNEPSEVLYEDDTEVAREVIDAEAITRNLLDNSDIMMTMEHDYKALLARSKKGQGTLSYSIDKEGVRFSFEAPHTTDGDKALELVRRGDIQGCSFMFRTSYRDPQCVSVERKVNAETGKTEVTYHVKAITSINDFTLTAMPAYDTTSVEARGLKPEAPTTMKPKPNNAEQVNEMRSMAHKPLV